MKRQHPITRGEPVRLDRFLTRPEAARSCMDWLRGAVDVSRFDQWIEPSAGIGVFLDLMPRPRYGLDIVPTAHPEIQEADFLAWMPTGATSTDATGNTDPTGKRTIVLGNPPFGKNASLAVRFFNHAARFAECIAMIVPRTFRKPSVANRLDMRFHLRAQFLMPDGAFMLSDVRHSVPTVFQVWTRESRERKPIVLSRTHPDFAFAPPDQGDFALQRVGCNAGRVKTDVAAVSASSHYFLKAPRTVMNTFRRINWAAVKYETAGNPSLSKADVVLMYTRAA